MKLLDLEPQRGKGIFYGWWILAACSFFNFYVGGTFLYGFTAFFNPLRREFGWTSAETALGFSLQRLEEGIAGPLVGYFFDRVGPRRLIFFGLVIAGFGLIFMSRIQSLPGFYLTFLLTAFGMSLGWAGPPMYAISNWFIRKRARALSFLMAGSGLSGFIVPLLVRIIARQGWRQGLLYVGLGLWLISIPLALVVRHRPEECGYLPDGDIPGVKENAGVAKDSELEERTISREVNFGLLDTVRTRTFWLIALTYMLSSLSVSSMMVFEMPHLESIGLPRETAGLVVTFTTLLSLGGRLGSGFLGDIIDKRYIIATALGLQSLGMLIFATIREPWHLIPFLIIYGTGYGASIPLRPALTADYFGRAHLGAILGLMISIMIIGGVTSPVVAGWFFDLAGNYRGIFAIYASMTLIGIPMILAAAKPPLRRKA